MGKALIIVDVQNDFCEGGSLAVTGGSAVASAISQLLQSSGGTRWDHVVASRDHHINPGEHFSETPNYVTTWPPHCVVGTTGVEFHPLLDTTHIETVFDKGEYEAAYSAFEGKSDGLSLAEWLHTRNITHVDVVGIATDHCVRATALDAQKEGFSTTVLLPFTAGVSPDTTETALKDLAAVGVEISR